MPDGGAHSQRFPAIFIGWPDSPEEAAIRLLIDYLQPLLTGLDDLAEQYRDEYGGSINEFAGYLSGQILRDQTIH